ncbi:histone deacetylase HDT1 isoform X2 [Mangifera indica]|uniref:histone deacetylase HDT1 isoform X2 n=1 Tax=Mangifera indica TaxID=29780 RepID=UPI001CF9FDD0|nr:histone deacetylase HDT1 isoform X2 [Mangifera indica]
MPSMEFWGIEVKSGQPQKVNPGGRRVIHLSQASLGEVKKDKGNGHVCLYLKVDDKKLVLGTLSPLKLPQLSFDLALEKDFVLSHNWKNGSVYFTGYRVKMDQTMVADSDDSDSDEDVKEILLRNSGKPELQAKSVSKHPNNIKPNASTAKENVKNVKPNRKFDDSDSDDTDSKDSSTDDDETSDDEDLNHISGESNKSGHEHNERDEDDEDSDESESDDEDETPKKAEPSRKRSAESATKSPVPDKKTKFITPQRTEGKKGVVHTATPHPSKRAQKAPVNSSQSKQQTQKSGGSFSCKSCNRSFTTEGGLEAHTKAKHGAAA